MIEHSHRFHHNRSLTGEPHTKQHSQSLLAIRTHNHTVRLFLANKINLKANSHYCEFKVDFIVSLIKAESLTSC